MHRMLAFSTLTFALGALACEPFTVLSGGALSGTAKAPPSSWDFTDEVETVQLETRPDDPYSVNIWCVADGPRIYVAGSRSSTWTQNAAADERVRLRVAEDVYELNAVEATDASDLEAFVAGAKAKYDFEPDVEQRNTSILFRLDPR